MELSQRRVGLGLIGLIVAGVAIILIVLLIQGAALNILLITAMALIVLCGVFVTYWREWQYAPVLVVLVMTALCLFQQEPYLTRQLSIVIFLPPVIALILARPPWVIGSAAVTLGGLIALAGGKGVYTDPLTIILYAMVIGGMILARIVTDTTQRRAEASADQARQALARSETQAHELAQKAEELATQNDEQRRLLDLVATLETPAVALADGVLLTPVVGHLDSRRADALTRRLLNEVSSQRARMVILDIAGVPTVDTAVAQALLRSIQAVRLLGCEVTITGISASVAATMTQLGINMAGVRTARTPQEVINGNLVVATKPMRN
jgi:anti-anti-sigma regulatory factor